LPNSDVAQHGPVALLNFVTAEAALGPDGHWWVCEWCRKSTVAAREHNVAFDAEYVRQLFPCHPSTLSMLGFLDVHLDIKKMLVLFSCQTGYHAIFCPLPYRSLCAIPLHTLQLRQLWSTHTVNPWEGTANEGRGP
jgi:hypothetical protein